MDLQPKSDRESANELLESLEDISDEEARKSIKKRIVSIVRPYVHELDRSIGHQLSEGLALAEVDDLEDKDWVSKDDYETFEYGREEFLVHPFSLGDLFELVRIRRALARLDIGGAARQAGSVDTDVRDGIPRDTYRFLLGR